MRKSILFIINPISGGRSKTTFPDLVNRYIDKKKYQPSYLITEAAGHARQVALDALHTQTDVVVAVGGDGTINEVASVLEGSGRQLGIIPCGSGNGLARSLGIPMNLRRAVERLNESTEQQIDTGEMNGRKFFNMAGVGFDAYICTLFARDQKRGFFGYVRTSFSAILSYKPQMYQIDIDGIIYDREAFMISVANSSQFGNNAYVSPKASLKDGLLDICIIKPFPLYHFPVMGYHMFTNTADKSRYVEIIRGRNIRIKRMSGGPVHLDGEPFEMGKELEISLSALNLKVLS